MCGNIGLTFIGAEEQPFVSKRSCGGFDYCAVGTTGGIEQRFHLINHLLRIRLMLINRTTYRKGSKGLPERCFG